MATIQSVKGKEVLDSRGTPTIEVTVEIAGGMGVASVPSGASVGVHEAVELRDGAGAANPKSVSKAIAQIHDEIAPAIVGKEFDQKSLDTFLCALDGTKNKSRLGANAILGISIAFARASAQERGVELYEYLGSLAGQNTFSLPVPLFNVLNGGKHAKAGIDIQECMLAPVGFTSMKEQVEVAKKCMAELKTLLEQKNCSTEMGDEGGFAPALETNDEALSLLVTAIEKAGYTTEQVKISLDVASSSFYEEGKYVLRSGGERSLTSSELVEWYAAMAAKYPIISIEDGLSEDDWEGFVALKKTLGSLSIVGDDLTVTNIERISMAVEKDAANACIIKPNQIGSVTESIDAVLAARKAGWKAFASHRSGETLDTFISDFAAGLSCDYIKAGAPTKPERTAKYDRLIEIENRLAA
ncbi:MAG: phosphopyruvate hydratase [bacterium]|nr:phosphopyruvate hydratase [bacterium]